MPCGELYRQLGEGRYIGCDCVEWNGKLKKVLKFEFLDWAVSVWRGKTIVYSFVTSILVNMLGDATVFAFNFAHGEKGAIDTNRIEYSPAFTHVAITIREQISRGTRDSSYYKKSI